ncbi:MAG: PEP-CTERM sorting domain-containing protein [Crocosphaera sp.]
MSINNSLRNLVAASVVFTVFATSTPSQAISLIFEETGTGNPNILGSSTPNFWSTSGNVEFAKPFNFIFEPGEGLDGTSLDTPPANANDNLGIVFNHGNGSKGGTIEGTLSFTPTYEPVSAGFKRARIAVSSDYGSGFWGRIKAFFKWRRARAWIRGNEDELAGGITVSDYRDVALNPGEFGGLVEPVSVDPDPNSFSIASNDIVFLEGLLRDDQDITQLFLNVTDENLAPAFDNGIHHIPYLYVYDDATPSDFGIDTGEARFVSLDFSDLSETELTIGYQEELSDVPVPEPTSILSLLSLGILGAGATLKRKLKPSNSIEK